jgi:hypothetical protein
MQFTFSVHISLFSDDYCMYLFVWQTSSYPPAGLMMQYLFRTYSTLRPYLELKFWILDLRGLVNKSLAIVDTANSVNRRGFLGAMYGAKKSAKVEKNKSVRYWEKNKPGFLSICMHRWAFLNQFFNNLIIIL